MKDKILLVIPFYNCEKQIIRVLKQLTDEVCSYLYEVIIVDNKSTDNGKEVVCRYLSEHRMPIKVSLFCNNENYGLGGTHKIAFGYAIENELDYVIVLHGDDQGSIMDLLPALHCKGYRKYDCCLGARFSSKSKLIGYSKFRIFGNRVFNIIFSVIMGSRIYDLGAGLNLYSVRMLEGRFFDTYPDNLTFNVYMLMATKAYKQKYCFFPLSWRETDQVSNAKVFSQAWKTLKMAVGFKNKGKIFLETDLRDKKISEYKYQLVYKGD